MGIGSMISSFFNPQRGYEKAGERLANAFTTAQNQTSQYEKPFVDYGMNQYGNLMNAQNRLLDPSSLMNEWISKYNTSPYAQQLMGQSRESGLDAASSMGLSGSSSAINNIQQGAGNIFNADRQQFLNDLMDKYFKGIGIGQNIFGTGANMAANLGNTLGNQSMQFGRDEAGLAYGAENSPGNLLEHLLSTGANVAGNYFTGGLYGAGKNASSAAGG